MIVDCSTITFLEIFQNKNVSVLNTRPVLCLEIWKETSLKQASLPVNNCDLTTVKRVFFGRVQFPWNQWFESFSEKIRKGVIFGMFSKIPKILKNTPFRKIPALQYG